MCKAGLQLEGLGVSSGLALGHTGVGSAHVLVRPLKGGRLLFCSCSSQSYNLEDRSPEVPFIHLFLDRVLLCSSGWPGTH